MAEAGIGAGKAKKTLTCAFKGFKDGAVDFLGDQVEAVTGYPRKDFNERHRKWHELALEEDRSGMKAAFVQGLKTDKTYTREYRIRGKRGDVLWMQEWSQIICDESGDIEYITGILMNITEQKLTEIDRIKAEERTGKYLTFSLAGQEYGVSILCVKEIIEILPITPVPQAPACVKGVINLRGKVIPVVDLRLKLDLESAEYNDRSCIVVVEVSAGAGARKLMGIVVDSVSDVVHIKGCDVEDSPLCIRELDSDYIVGMAKFDKNLKIILNMDLLLGERN